MVELRTIPWALMHQHLLCSKKQELYSWLATLDKDAYAYNPVPAPVKY